MKTRLQRNKWFIELIGEIARKPGMCLPMPSYAGPYYWGLCCLIDGVDRAYDRELLEEFNGWLKKRKAPKNLVWSGAFLFIVFGDQDPYGRILKSQDDDKIAMARLVDTFKTILLLRC